MSGFLDSAKIAMIKKRSPREIIVDKSSGGGAKWFGRGPKFPPAGGRPRLTLRHCKSKCKRMPLYLDQHRVHQSVWNDNFLNEYFLISMLIGTLFMSHIDYEFLFKIYVSPP